MLNNTKNKLILSSLIASSIISFSACSLKNIKVIKEPEVFDISDSYSYDEISNYFILYCYNIVFNENQLFIVKKEEANYSNGRGYNYINVINNEILSDNEFIFLDEEYLLNYLDEFKPTYSSEDINNIYSYLITGDSKTKILK